MKNFLIALSCCCCTSLLGQKYTIPTVVHVLYYHNSEDMTATEVQQLIDHANLGLRGMSLNNNVSRQIFDTLWADTEIQLCLADRNESGAPTDGVVHKQLSSPIDIGDYFRTKGESLPWNTDLYLNVWISSMGVDSELYGGIATTPTITHSNFPNPYIGVMINWDNYNPEQIFIHEVGHYFGLDHLYFDDITDTPCSNNAINPEPSCEPSFLTINTCTQDAAVWGGVDPPDMIENYMEYYGNCAKMFTKGQKAYMHDYVENYYLPLVHNPGAACNLMVGLSDFPMEKLSAKTYPNPVKSSLNIELAGRFAYHLHDAQGRKVLEGEGVDASVLEVGSLPAGVYFLQLQNGRVALTKKVIKA